jgi:hypothetical protein
MNTMWIAIARMAAVFDIEGEIGPDGKEIKPAIEFHSAGIAR